jgi:glycosyltransferase 2 family protein
MRISDRQKKWIQFFLFLLGLILLIYIITKSGIVDNVQTLFTISIPLLILAFILSNLNILFKIYRWKYLSEKYGQSINWYDAAVVTVSSFYFANITPGKIGDLFKAYYMQKRYSLGFFDGVSMIFYERFFELVILFLTASAVIFIEFHGITVIILEASAIIIVLLTFFYYKADFFMNLAEKALIRLPVLNIKEMNFHIRKLPFSQIVVVFFITFVSLVLEFARLWVIALAFGFFLNPLQISMFFSLAIIAGLISQIPLGIGIMEGSLSYLIQEMGVDPITSISIVLTDRTISMYYALILGLVFSTLSLDKLKEVPA